MKYLSLIFVLFLFACQGENLEMDSSVDLQNAQKEYHQKIRDLDTAVLESIDIVKEDYFASDDENQKASLDKEYQKLNSDRVKILHDVSEIGSEWDKIGFELHSSDSCSGCKNIECTESFEVERTGCKSESKCDCKGLDCIKNGCLNSIKTNSSMNLSSDPHVSNSYKYSLGAYQSLLKDLKRNSL